MPTPRPTRALTGPLTGPLAGLAVAAMATGCQAPTTPVTIAVRPATGNLAASRPSPKPIPRVAPPGPQAVATPGPGIDVPSGMMTPAPATRAGVPAPDVGAAPDVRAPRVDAEAGGRVVGRTPGIEAMVPPGALDRDADVRLERLPAPPVREGGDRPVADFRVDLGGAALAPDGTLKVRVQLADPAPASDLARFMRVAGGERRLAIDVVLAGPGLVPVIDPATGVKHDVRPGPTPGSFEVHCSIPSMPTPESAPGTPLPATSPSLAASPSPAPSPLPSAAVPSAMPTPAPVARLDDVVLTSRTLRVRLRDAEEQDGDRVRVTLNGVVVPGFADHVLTSAGDVLSVRLSRAENELRVEALNEGWEAPNTCEVEVLDEIVLSGPGRQTGAQLKTGEALAWRLVAHDLP